MSERIAHSEELFAGLPREAGDVPLRWRHMRRRDARGIHGLRAVAGRIDHPFDSVERDAVSLELRDPRFTPSGDGLVALDPRGGVVAEGAARLEEEPDPTATVTPHREVSLPGTVHPDFRGRGIGAALLAWQEARGRELLAAAASARPGMLTVGTREACAQATALYSAAGFTPERWWLSLERDLARPIPDGPLPAGVTVSPMRRRFSEPARVALNDAFRDHWGFSPIDRSEWRRQAVRGGFAPRLSRLAIAGHGTRSDPHRVAAFALTEINRREWRLQGSCFGYLETIGVVRDWRGRGLSTAVIASALRAYRGRGLTRAVLDVDSDNPSGALGMYERLGFTERDRSVSYLKRS